MRTPQLTSNEKDPIAVIFAGGSGTRLWPISSKEDPKQLNSFFSKETLLVEAYKRALKIFKKENILIVTTQDLSNKIKKLISINSQQIIVQPQNSDTTAAVAITALTLNTRYPNSLAIILYSDHVIQNINTFKKEVLSALEIANNLSEIVTIGTKPTAPVEDFGYIKLGSKTKHANLYEIDSFTEKPDKDTAQKYLDSGNYLWNTGVYIWSPEVLLEKIKEIQPKLYEELLKLRIAVNEPYFDEAIKEWYEETPKESFDTSISEKLKKMHVYEAEYRWLDVGNWRSIYELQKKDANGNAVLHPDSTDIFFINTKNSLVYSPSQKVGIVGLEDVVVIQTDQELLVCHKDSVADVKKIAKALHEQ